MTTALCREMQIRAPEAGGKTIQTVYLGGGTPSLLDNQLLENILSSVRENYIISLEAEITLEANPDDISPEHLEFWKRMGINRLSIGIQSFRKDDLVYLNRVHSAEQAYKCIHIAREYGFPDLTIDLIYGIPTLENIQWIENLEVFAELQLPHLSAYALTVEPRTPLHLQIEKGEARPVDEKQSSEQFEILMQFMQEKGYVHYEISNFCLPGHYAKHNLSYWKGIDYIGFGPSAHSFNGTSRQWNVSSVTEYIKSLKENTVPYEREELSLTNRYNEYVMTGLRTIWGCNLNDIEAEFGEELKNYFISQSQQWIRRSLLIRNGDIFTLGRNGKLLADGIASDLFMV